jgi:hypothetical protein
MSDSTRYTVPAEWANAAAPANIVEPSPAKQDAGFVAEKPLFENFNWAWQMFTNMLKNAEQYGVMQWRSTTEYQLKGLSFGSDGRIYQSQTGANIGNDPVLDSGTNWKVWVGEAIDTNEVILISGTTSLTQSAADTYTYNIADFTGTGIDTDQIRELHGYVYRSGDNGSVMELQATIGDDSTFKTISKRLFSSEDNGAGSGHDFHIRINPGQNAVKLKILDSGTGSLTYTLQYVTQRVMN